MANPNQSNTAFVDYGEGNDETAELDNPNLKFKTFDAAYTAIDNLGFEREVYIISVGFGNYLMDLEIYGGFSVESTNEIDGLTPLILISDKVKLFKGLIINDVTLYIPLPSKTFKSPLSVDGVEWTNSGNYIFEVVDIDIDIYIKDTSKLNNIIKSNKQLLKSNKKQLLKSNTKLPDNPLNNLKPLLSNKQDFIDDAKGVINLALSDADITTDGIYSFIDNESGIGKLVLAPANITSRQFVKTVIKSVANILFRLTGDKGESILRTELDSIWAIIKNVQEPENIDDLSKITIMFENVDISIDIKSNELSNFILKINTIPDIKIKNNIVDIDNKAVQEIKELVKIKITNIINNSKQNVINKLGFDVDNLPLISCLDSNIGSRAKKEFHNINFCNTLEYMTNNSNISGIILEDDSLNPHATYPIINVSEKEGGNIRKGSKFTRYKIIQENYIHDREDGVVFLVNAKNNNIKIIIPKEVNGNNDIWKGRNIIYKRIDRSNNKVYIINKRGNFDGIDSCVELKSCKKSSLKIIIAENGNSYII